MSWRQRIPGLFQNRSVWIGVVVDPKYSLPTNRSRALVSGRNALNAASTSSSEGVRAWAKLTVETASNPQTVSTLRIMRSLTPRNL